MVLVTLPFSKLLIPLVKAHQERKKDQNLSMSPMIHEFNTKTLCE